MGPTSPRAATIVIASSLSVVRPLRKGRRVIVLPKSRRATVVRAPAFSPPSCRGLSAGISPGRLKNECLIRGDPSLPGAVRGRLDSDDGDASRRRVFRSGVWTRCSHANDASAAAIRPFFASVLQFCANDLSAFRFGGSVVEYFFFSPSGGIVAFRRVISS